MADVERLVSVMKTLVEAGNTIIVIEHNIETWCAADWLLDVGPEGGDGGGQLVAMGSPKAFLKSSRSHTANALREAS